MYNKTCMKCTNFVLISDPPKVTAMHLVESGPTSLSLQWSVSHRATPITTRYELMYRKKVGNVSS